SETNECDPKNIPEGKICVMMEHICENKQSTPPPGAEPKDGGGYYKGLVEEDFQGSYAKTGEVAGTIVTVRCSGGCKDGACFKKTLEMEPKIIAE
ncbi:MAG: hypothetical protein AABX05_00145, partial [Nanoarchaeota archaeon]